MWLDSCIPIGSICRVEFVTAKASDRGPLQVKLVPVPNPLDFWMILDVVLEVYVSETTRLSTLRKRTRNAGLCVRLKVTVTE